jgi:Xaa-Pro dipeptidase
MNFKPNLTALQGLVQSEHLSALVAMSPANFTYVSGVFILTVPLIPSRQAFAVIPATGEPFLVVCSIEESQLRAEGWIDNIQCYTEYIESPIAKLASALSDIGIRGGRIGFDLDHLPVSSFHHLTTLLPAVELVNSSEPLASIRAIKTSSEIAAMQKITQATHRAVLDGMAACQPGDTERDMANRVISNMIENGADGTLFVCFASAERTIQPHAHAGSLVPPEGDLIHIDIGGTYGAWASDFARMYSTGNPTDTQRDVYRKLCEVQAAAIEAIRPGVLAEDIFFLCNEQFQHHGIPFRMPHVGHSFGVSLHEAPMLRPGDKTPLAAGMVLNVEPTILYEDRAYHNEDLVLITETGCRILSLGLPPMELPEIGHRIL